MLGVASPRPLRERAEFQVELKRNLEIRVRGLFMSKHLVTLGKCRDVAVYGVYL